MHAAEKLTSFCATWNRGLHLLVFGYIFYFLIVLIIALCDLVYTLPEFCSVVAHEICGLECFARAEKTVKLNHAVLRKGATLDIR